MYIKKSSKQYLPNIDNLRIDRRPCKTVSVTLTYKPSYKFETTSWKYFRHLTKIKMTENVKNRLSIVHAAILVLI